MRTPTSVSDATRHSRRSNDGSITSFIGREHIVAEVEQALRWNPVVTLTGMGGVGKTRLARRVVAQSEPALGDVVCFVELDTLEHDAGMDTLAGAIALALSVSDQSNRDPVEKVLNALSQRRVLLVLDNCEHVLMGTAALVSLLLAANPDLRVLATSREALMVAGEAVLPVPPLETPPEGALDKPEDALSFEAVQLLVDRARNNVRDFAVTAENVSSVVQLCRLLDGVPLAIELAATRLRSLSATQLVERLDHRFQLLTVGERTARARQRTLRALIDWSHELCSEAEQALWRRLSVFTGSFDLEAAESVCAFGLLDQAAVLDALDRLVAKSLLVAERGAHQVRYRQLMTIREYGFDELIGSGDENFVRARHRDHYTDKARRMVEDWCGPSQAESLAGMRQNHANLASALEWSLSNPEEVAAGAELASLLRFHWIAGGFLSAGRRYLEDALKLLPPDAVRLRAEVLWVAAWVALIQGDRDRGEEWLLEGEHLARSLEDPALQAHMTQWLAEHRFFSGNVTEAAELLRDALAQHVAHGDTASELITRFQLALALTYSSEEEEALAECGRAIALSSRYGERWARSYAHWISGICHWHLGENKRAVESSREALTIQSAFMDRICTALTIELLSWIAASTADLADAAELALLADAVWTRLGTTAKAFGPNIVDDASVSAGSRDALDDQQVEQLRSRQSRLSRIEVIDTALSLVDPSAGRPSGRARKKSGAPLLTDREQQVADLIANGMSNREIGENLFISRRTVDGHVERILTKLGAFSRAQVATWVVLRQATTETTAPASARA